MPGYEQKAVGVNPFPKSTPRNGTLIPSHFHDGLLVCPASPHRLRPLRMLIWIQPTWPGFSFLGRLTMYLCGGLTCGSLVPEEEAKSTICRYLTACSNPEGGFR